MELLVGMIISALIISMCYYGYAIIQEQYISYRNSKSQIIQTMQLNALLNKDFVDSKVAFYKDNELNLVTQEGQIIYTFRDTYISRSKSDLSDTFKFSISSVNVHQLRMNMGEVVDAFYFDAVLFNQTQRFNFSKTYSAEALINTAVQITEN